MELHNKKLTFEELATLAVKIKAVLNSRPLVAMTSLPDDLEILTPGHFIIGQQITALPIGGGIVKSVKSSWKEIQEVKDKFWGKWSQKYLLELNRGLPNGGFRNQIFVRVRW